MRRVLLRPFFLLSERPVPICHILLTGQGGAVGPVSSPADQSKRSEDHADSGHFFGRRLTQGVSRIL